MLSPVVDAYRRLADSRPLVRPSYNEFEVSMLPPYGDPEVHIPGEVSTYVVAALAINALAELLHEE